MQKNSWKTAVEKENGLHKTVTKKTNIQCVKYKLWDTIPKPVVLKQLLLVWKSVDAPGSAYVQIKAAIIWNTCRIIT